MEINSQSQLVLEQMNQWGQEKSPFAFLIDFECNKPLCWKLEAPKSPFKFNFQGIKNYADAPTNNINSKSVPFAFTPRPISLEAYKVKFDGVKREIEYGNSFLVNLTVETPIVTNYTLEQLFILAKAKYTCWLKDNFVCFSPETFVQIKNGQIFSYPMKGTIDASIPNAEALLLNDAKEIAEHVTIVDLIRNDLSRVSENVHVSRFRFYEELKTQDGLLGQISSEIVGQLPSDYATRIGTLIFDLLPAGSISGAPKAKTEKIIFEAEQAQRGYYTGVAGYFDGTNLDSCVLIRYLQADGTYRSGGGITFQSELQKEYQEMINKIYVPIF